MTVIAGLVDAISNSMILLADCRVTSSQGDQHFDVCQKTISLDNQGVLGFSGYIDTAGEVAHWINERYAAEGVGWLNSKLEVVDFLRQIKFLGHSKGAAFIVGFMDDVDHGDTGEPRATLVRLSTQGDYSRTRLGLEMIGTGQETYQPIRAKLTEILQFGGAGLGGLAVANRAFLLSEMIVTEARARAIK